MKKNLLVVMLVLIVVGLMSGAVLAQNLSLCEDMAYSTEEDFVTQGPVPPDGNPLISDGDLLSPGCAVCARNSDLLAPFEVQFDLGLDAADIIDVESELVAFSTELDFSSPLFTAGDLLATNGAIIPNIALLYKTDLSIDLGLDAIHFIGNKDNIIEFLDYAKNMGRAYWIEIPGNLAKMLEEFNIDIWFSTEGTAPTAANPAFLDGDLLSARNGTVIQPNSNLLPITVPAGIPSRGVDFGLDAVTADRSGSLICFSTEILYDTVQRRFTDGDVLEFGNGVVEFTNSDLLIACEPKADFLGLDALYKNQERKSHLPFLLNLLLNEE